MNYKDELIKAMDSLAADRRTIFVGYGLLSGRAAGTLKNIPEEQILEMPTAENLLVGTAIGLSLAGRRPVVYFERADFLLNAADAIVNHLDKIEAESRGEFAPKVILRVVVGNKRKPLFTGSTHTQDLSAAFKHMVRFPVMCLHDAAAIIPNYNRAAKVAISSMLFEYKDLI